MKRSVPLFVLVLCAGFVVAGCAAKYVAPTTGPIAQLTLVNKTDVQTLFRVINNDDCDPGKDSPLLAVTGGNPPDTAQPVTRDIRAGRKFVLSVQGSQQRYNSYRWCTFTVQFRPAPWKQYEAEFMLSDDYSKCEVKVSRLADEGSSVRRIPVPVRYDPRNCSG